MARRVDRRVQRTRKLLQDSLMELTLEEGYDAIAIQDITNKANLGRATFYLHYKDKDELLLDTIGQFLADFLEQVPQLSHAQWRLDDSKALTRLFDFAAEHYDLYRILIIGSGGITASQQLRRSIANSIQQSIAHDLETEEAQPLVPIEFMANHFAGTLLSTIYWWLDSDMPYPPDEMAALFQKVNQIDRETLLGIQQAQPATVEPKEQKKKKSKEKNDLPKKSDDDQPADSEQLEADPPSAPKKPEKKKGS